ncbi:MAG TPA: hypothetical protein VFF73_05220 [Planctomycetota bacterium]|nr:hypothetical protein [Planctomycetota bacterium]
MGTGVGVGALAGRGGGSCAVRAARTPTASDPPQRATAPAIATGKGKRRLGLATRGADSTTEGCGRTVRVSSHP